MGTVTLIEKLKYVVAQLIVELWRWISVGALVFQAAASSAEPHARPRSAHLFRFAIGSR